MAVPSPPELSLRVNKNKIKIYVLKERAAKVENSNIQLPGLLSSCEERRVLEWSTRLVLRKQQKQTILSQSIGKEINSHITGLGHQHSRRFIRELYKPQQRQHRRKRCFELYRAYGNFFLELNSKRLYQSSGKEKESSCQGRPTRISWVQNTLNIASLNIF